MIASLAAANQAAPALHRFYDKKKKEAHHLYKRMCPSPADFAL